MANYSRLKTALNYVKVEEAMAYGRPNNQQQIWGSAEVAIGGGVSIFGGGRYDLISDQIIDRHIGIGFDCDCMKLRSATRKSSLPTATSIGTGPSCWISNW